MKTKQAKFYHGLISIGVLAALMFVSVVVLGTEPQIPLVLGCIIAGIIATVIGYKWDDILESMLTGIHQSLEAVLILFAIGILVSTWIASGTVPAMIYYGLSIVTPRTFLVATFVVCSIVSMIVGAWGTVGSVGLAFLGIGQTIGLDSAIVVGAIVAGAYVGDKLSPFSDGTNLAASVAGADLFKMIKEMFGLFGVIYIICIIVYVVIGLGLPVADAAEIAASIDPLQEAIAGNFKIGVFSFLPLVVMIVCVIFKMPSLPALLVGAFAGALQAVFVQGIGATEIIGFATSGFVSETGLPFLDDLLSAGGLETMLRTVSIIVIAMAFGGIMQGTGQMEALVEPIVKRIRSWASMIAVTIVTCIGANILLPDQYLGITVPGQMYGREFEKRGMSKELLGNVLGAGAAVTSALVPWNTCGMYVETILGASAPEYGIYAVFNWVLPIGMILFGILLTAKNRRKTGEA